MAAAAPMPNPAVVTISEPAWAEAEWLPCQVRVEIPVAAFTLGDLVSLKVNAIVDTRLAGDSSVAVTANGATIANGKLDMNNNSVAVRLTDIE